MCINVVYGVIFSNWNRILQSQITIWFIELRYLYHRIVFVI